MPDKNAKLKTFIMLGIWLSTTSAAHAFQAWEGALRPENFNEARLNKLQPPDKVMDAIGLEPGMTAAEIGAGRGRYVMHLAHRVEKNGRVYAEDIDAGALRHLEQRCARWGIDNVETILGEVKDPKLPQGSLDLIFIISSYHHFDDPVELLRNARPSLKPTGVLAIGEWLPRDENSEEATTPKAMEAQMKEAGYRLDRIETFLKDNNLYIYIFRPE
ncbi:MAG: class I SAM-dependent methyltransferase [Candidatus Aminicenantales bacterium]